MAVIDIIYNEGAPKRKLGYKSVNIKYNNLKKKKAFSSGDFVKDWYDLWKFIISEDFEEPVAHSSSVNHFIMDGAPYDSAYLHIVDGKGVLKYIDRTNPKWYLDHDTESGIELFVPKGNKPTWNELKGKYQNKKILK